MRNFLQKFKISTKSEYPSKEIADREREEYLKFILNFKRPVDDMRRIGMDIYALEEYDLVDEISPENHLAGRLDKRFIRLHKLYFSSLFEEVKNNPKCSYVTFMENEDIVTEDVPTNLSVLLKEIKDVSFVDESVARGKLYSEAVSPRIMNYFGTPTVFNEMLFHDDHLFVLSLDFIKTNQYFYMSNKFDEESEIAMYSPIKENHENIETKFELLKQ